MPDPSSSASSEANPFSRLLSQLRGALFGRNGEASLRQSLEEAIEEREGGIIDPDDLSAVERTMLRNLLRYGDLRVDDVAVPRADIIAFEATGGFDDLVKLFAEAGHSRLPVYRETLDGVIGMVHVKDVYQRLASPEQDRPRIDSLLRSVLFVPPSMRVLDLLARMRLGRIHMAIVVDEFGGTDGLVTIEDLVEEIVGDIQDEHDEQEAVHLTSLGGGRYDADARLPLDELENALGVTFVDDREDAEVDTLGGLIFMIAGRVPIIGEVILHEESGYAFEILDGDPRRITRARVLPPHNIEEQGRAAGARG